MITCGLQSTSIVVPSLCVRVKYRTLQICKFVVLRVAVLKFGYAEISQAQFLGVRGCVCDMCVSSSKMFVGDAPTQSLAHIAEPGSRWRQGTASDRCHIAHHATGSQLFPLVDYLSNVVVNWPVARAQRRAKELGRHNFFEEK